jgi:hypothetical protein
MMLSKGNQHWGRNGYGWGYGNKYGTGRGDGHGWINKFEDVEIYGCGTGYGNHNGGGVGIGYGDECPYATITVASGATDLLLSLVYQQAMMRLNLNNEEKP